MIRAVARGIIKAAMGISTLALVSGCNALKTNDAGKMVPNVPNSALPSAVQPYAEIDEALKCIGETGVLRSKMFRVGAFADSTGKANSVAAGATGSYLPQGGSSAYVTDAIRKAGGQVITSYFGPARVETDADYVVNGIFNSLDFGSPTSLDLRIKGLGPVIANGWAQVSLAIQLDDDRTRLNRQLSLVQRPVKFQQIGFSVGRDFGGTLVTGSGNYSQRERLQLEALNGPIALGVAHVLVEEFSAARKKCGDAVYQLMNGPALSDAATH